MWLSLGVLPCAFVSPAVAQSQQPPVVQGSPDAQGKGASIGTQPDQQLSGNVSGTVMVQTGAVAVGAQVELTREGQSGKQEVLSDDNGHFSFANLPPGPFQLTVASPGFATESYSGALRPGEAVIVPPIMLSIAAAVTEVKVELTEVEVAEVQIKEQEKQRVLGIIPNFYVTYLPDAAPLVPRQKFQLASRSVIDPFTFVAVGALAGIQQEADQYGAYGQGAEGYAKRYGAAYAGVVTGTFIGSAILPSLLKQDPRYFYKGTGSTGSRLLYALGNAVIAKGDNKRWQPNYSGILGSFAEGGISYLYYPANDRNGGLFVENSLIRIAESAVAGVFQEFVLRRLTPRLQSHPSDPLSSTTDQVPGKSQPVQPDESKNSE
ncbi:MAG: carboxypeptidase-like regulatory domain-containing protein [Candidatus Korobacteraceae bacterium]